MKKSSLLKHCFLALAVCGGLGFPAYKAALADIMIMPIRIVFNSRDRMQDITVFNSSTVKAGTYMLSWIFAQQMEDGSYKHLDHPLNPELDPATTILFSPRQVTLQPGGKQRVRLSLRRPADLPDGEYRAHLQLQNTTRQSAGGLKQANGASIGMGMRVGVAVPVIIRQGPYDGTAKINPPTFVPRSADGKIPPQIRFTIDRGGKYSTIGNVKIFWTPPGEKEEELIGQQNAINIFTEVQHRAMRIPLTVNYLAGGKVRIIFAGDGPDKGITFDEKTFPIGG